MSKHPPKPRPNRAPATPAADPDGSATVRNLEALAAGKAEGRVKFDDRGNAVWEWAVNTAAPSAESGSESTSLRTRRLDHPGLSIAEDAPSPFDLVKANPMGVIKGYNPYDSGKLGKPAAPRKKDLRKLSEWLKLKKQASANKAGDK